MFEGSKGSLGKIFWKILFLAQMIGEYEKAAYGNLLSCLL